MSSSKSKSFISNFSLHLTFYYTSLFTSITIGVCVTSYYFLEMSLKRNDMNTLSERIANYTRWYSEGGPMKLSSEFNSRQNPSGDIFFIRLISAKRNALLLQIPEGVKSTDVEMLKRISPFHTSNWQQLTEKSEDRTWSIAVIHLPGGVIMQAGKNSIMGKSFLDMLYSTFFKIVVPILIFGIIFGAIMTHRWTRPIRSLINTVKNIIDTGKLDSRVPFSQQNNELDDLITLFNKMLDKNQSLIHGMNDSLNNVAHDLRTPMTRLKNSAEFAIQDENPEVCREALADCLEESDQILTMLNTLMNVAEAETGAMLLDLNETSVNKVVTKVVDLYEFLAEEKSIELTSDLQAESMISADPNRLHQVIANLIDNSIKYSTSGKHIAVRTYETPTDIYISVEDHGIGISESEQNKIFDRLYRGDRSRTQRGLGLGLSFVKAITTAHSGKIEVTSDINKGATFTISLPKS